ncbi:MAG: AAA family ATPase [Lachnospiraceae bacterium]|nr:AAA family ATPase [Lachnospiraceae bacterium]
MRLLSCHIENFGRLTNFDYVFGEGISQICEENGFGKSTFCAFLLAMFYGFEGDRRHGLNSERAYYDPWQGGVYGGSVSFETKGKRYRFDKTFGKKESEDTFELYDLSTGLKSSDYSSGLGQELFGIDRHSFMKTVFIGQDALKTEATDRVNALIGNLSSEEGDISVYEKADRLLKTVLDGETPKRRTGRLYEQNERLQALKTQEAKGPALEQALTEVLNKLQKTEERIEELKAEGAKAQKTFEDAVSCADDRRQMERFEELRMSAAAKAAVTAEYRKAFPKGVPEQYEILSALNAASNCRQDLQKAEENRLSDAEAERLKEDLEAFNGVLPPEEELNEAMASESRLETVRESIRIHTLTQAEKKRFETLSRAYGTSKKDPAQKARGRRLAAIVLTSAGVILFMLSFFLPAFLSLKPWDYAVSGVLLLLGVILMLGANVRQKNEEKEEWTALSSKAGAVDEEALRSEEETLSGQIRSFLKRFGAESADTRFSDELLYISRRASSCEKLLKRQEAFEQAMREAGYERSALDSFFAKYGLSREEDAGSMLNSLLTSRNALLNAKKNEDDAAFQLAAFEKTHDIEAMRQSAANAPEMSAEDAKQAISALSLALEETRKERNALTRQLEDLRQEQEAWEDGHAEYLLLMQKHVEDTKRYRLIEKTRALLLKARDAMTTRYSKPLLEAFNGYLTQMTGREEQGYSLNARSELSHDESGRKRELATFSKGYQDLLSLCLRFAFIDAMYPEEKPFVILDDPFTNLDTEKTARALLFLAKASETYQIVYMTCHESREFR